MQSDLYQLQSNNSHSAYQEIYKAHYRPVKQFVLQNSGSADVTADPFQDSMIALWDNVIFRQLRRARAQASIPGIYSKCRKLFWLNLFIFYVLFRQRELVLKCERNVYTENYGSDVFTFAGKLFKWEGSCSY